LLPPWRSAKACKHMRNQRCSERAQRPDELSRLFRDSPTGLKYGYFEITRS
jgi:hypothetical protein